MENKEQNPDCDSQEKNFQFNRLELADRGCLLSAAFVF